VRRGDTLTLDLPGGGGYGDPFLREPALVLSDWERGFVSAAGAAEDYGVVISAAQVDAAATAKLRAERPEPPGGFFDFGPDRRAWEAVFDDATMDELNRRLYALPRRSGRMCAASCSRRRCQASRGPMVPRSAR